MCFIAKINLVRRRQPIEVIEEYAPTVKLNQDEIDVMVEQRRNEPPMSEEEKARRLKYFKDFG